MRIGMESKERVGETVRKNLRKSQVVRMRKHRIGMR
jgi:hypothetical protein